MIDFFGMDGNSKKLTKNGYEDDDVKDATESQELSTFRKANTTGFWH